MDDKEKNRNCRHEILIDFFPRSVFSLALCVWLSFSYVLGVFHLNTNGLKYFRHFSPRLFLSLFFLVFLFNSTNEIFIFRQKPIEKFRFFGECDE